MYISAYTSWGRSREAAADSDAVQGDIDAAVLATFERFDADESGTIDASELAEALRDVGLTVDDGQVGYMLRKYDDDRNATLDINEFAQLVADLNVNTPESMQARLSLRADPRVLEQLEVWWATAVHSMGQEQYERQQMADTIAPAPAPAPKLERRLVGLTPSEEMRRLAGLTPSEEMRERRLRRAGEEAGATSLKSGALAGCVYPP